MNRKRLAKCHFSYKFHPSLEHTMNFISLHFGKIGKNVIWKSVRIYVNYSIFVPPALHSTQNLLVLDGKIITQWLSPENFPFNIFDAFSTVYVWEILVTTDRQTLTILFGKMTANCRAAKVSFLLRETRLHQNNHSDFTSLKCTSWMWRCYLKSGTNAVMHNRVVPYTSLVFIWN